MAEKDVFTEAEEVNVWRNPHFKFKEVGDKVRGFFVGYDDIPNTFPGKEGTNQRCYTLKVKDGEMYQAWTNKDEPKEVVGGELIDVYGNAPTVIDGVKTAVCYGFEKLRVGQMVGFEFWKEEDTGKPMKAKFIKPLAWKEWDKELKAGTINDQVIF